MTNILLDPTDERAPVLRSLAVRPQTLRGRVALLDISKPRGSVLLDRLEARLLQASPGISIKRYRKPTFAKPAPADLRNEILANSDFLIEALAD